MARSGLVPRFLISKLQVNHNSGSFQGSVLFLDISGFTKMTGELAVHGKAGAQVLSHAINRVFAPVLELVDEVGGFVSTFAGDALTAIFPDAGPDRVVETAQRIAMVFDREYVQATSFGEFTLDMKIGIAEGAVDWGIVGSGGILAGYFRGKAIDGAALAEHAAGPGEIIVSAELASRLSDSFEFEPVGNGNARARRTAPAGGPEPPVSHGSNLTVRAAATTGNHVSLQERFVPRAVIDNDGTGEFRTVASVFLTFDDPRNHQEIARILEPILQLVEEFGGYFNVLDFGDKGGVVLVVFGAPRSRGDMARRTAGFVSEVARRVGRTIRIGFSIGTAFAGFVGSSLRATYTVLGPTVNLAARLSLAAEFGSAITAGDAVTSLAEKLQAAGLRTLKGFDSPVAVYRIVTEEEHENRGDDATASQRRSVSPRGGLPVSPPERTANSTRLYGRQAELRKIREWLLSAIKGPYGRLLMISGEAGAGKSIVAHTAFRGVSRRLAVVWLYADTILKKSLNPFKGLLEWFRSEGFPASRSTDSDLASRLRDLMERISPYGDDTDKSTLHDGIPALSHLFGSAVEDDDFRHLDPQARFERGVRALLALLRTLSRRRPLLLVVEDADALDADSATVVERFLRMKSPAGHAVAFVLRSVDTPTVSALVDSIAGSVMRVELGTLTFDSMSDIIAAELHGPPDSSLAEFVIRRVGSNPFYAKELTAYLARRGLIRRGERGYRLISSEVALPEGISSLMLTRFDSLSPEVQGVARVAALLGSEFRVRELAMVLEPEVVKRAMMQPDAQSLWSDEGDGVYRFRQELVRETIEHTQLDASLQETHGRIADALEKDGAVDPSRFADLAHHTDLAGRARDAQRYLKLAAEYATANFKNEKAIEFYLRFIERATGIGDKIEALGAIAEVYNVVGNWQEAENSLVFAIGLCIVARDVRARVRLMTQLGAVYQRRGHGSEAASVLEASVALARRLSVHGLLADGLIEYGRILSGKGDFNAASRNLDEAIKESRIEGDVRREGLSLYYRGVIYRDQSRYDDALRYYNEAKARFEAAEDDRLLTYPLYDMGLVHQYTGATDESRSRFEEVIRVYERIGYRSGTAAAVLNLGVLEDRKGDFESAQRYFKQSREIADEIGEKLASAYAVFSMGATYYKMRDHRRALFYLKQSYELLRSLDARSYYGYPLSYLVCLYADTGAVDHAVRACFLHLKNVREIDADVENGRAYLGMALALSNGEPASKTARDLLKRITHAAHLPTSTAEAFFRLAISKSSVSRYVNTLIPALHEYGRFLLQHRRIDEANLYLEKAYRMAIDAKWEHFVATFQSDHAELVETFGMESAGAIVAPPGE